MHRFIPIYAAWNGGRVTEVPVTHHARLHGKSNYGLERLLKVVLDLMVLGFLYRFLQKPMYLFGSVGLLSFMISGGAGFAAVYFKYFGGKSFHRNPTANFVRNYFHHWLHVFPDGIACGADHPDVSRVPG